MANDLWFRRLRLRNWKNFHDIDIEIQDRMFLVGANAAGKSNLLDAFRFLKDLVSVGGGFEEAVERRGGIKAIRCLAARRNTDVEIEVDIQERHGSRWQYEIHFNEGSRRRPELRKERVSRGRETIIDRPEEEDSDDDARLSQTFLEQVNVNRDFRDLATFFKSIRYLHVVPQMVRDPERSIGRSDDPYGGDFLDQIAKVRQDRRERRLKRIEQALRIAVPQFKELDFKQDKRGLPHLRMKYEHWRPYGAWQTEEQFSDGTLRLIGLLWAAINERGPLLLEEPEISLHSDIVRRLPQMLESVRKLPSKQIFLSTHSPELLADEGIGLDETLLFLPGHEGAEIVPASSFKDVQALLEGGLDLGDAVIPKTHPPGAMGLSRLTDA